MLGRRLPQNCLSPSSSQLEQPARDALYFEEIEEAAQKPIAR